MVEGIDEHESLLVGSDITTDSLTEHLGITIYIEEIILQLESQANLLAKLKYSQGLYQSLGVYLPLITTNCAVLGVALTNVQNHYNFITSVVAGFGTAVGFTISIIILAGIRERIEDNDIPHSFKGSPIVLIAAGLMAIAFIGFSGLI